MSCAVTVLGTFLASPLTSLPLLADLIHAVALAALASSTKKEHDITAKLWVTGIALFSGSLYGLALGGPRVLGPVTPMGGLCFIAGWLNLAINA